MSYTYEEVESDNSEFIRFTIDGVEYYFKKLGDKTVEVSTVLGDGKMHIMQECALQLRNEGYTTQTGVTTPDNYAPLTDEGSP